MVTYVSWKGVRVTPWMAYQLDRLDHDIYDAFGVRIGATSGIRLHQEQVDIFLRRYVAAGAVRGRKVYDTRWWNGRLWYRISSAGTVAVPGTSDHEIQGNRAAVDIYDTGSDAGITVKNSTRGRWLRAREHLYDMDPDGDRYAEGWHHRISNIFKTPPSGGGSSVSPPKPAPTRRRRKMSVGVIYTDDKTDAKRSGAIVDWEAGTFSAFGWFTVAYANGVAIGHGLEAAGKVTRGHYEQIRKDIAAKAARDGKVFVDIADEDVPQIKQ